VLVEPRGPRDHLTGVVEDDGVPVEHELVLSPTRLQKAKNALVSRARVTSISSRSSAFPTWYGDADKFTRS